MGCPAFSLGLRGTLVARGSNEDPWCRLEQSSAAELFVLSLRVDVECWPFGLLEF